MKIESDHLHLGCGLTAPDDWLNVDGSWQVTLARRPWIKKLLVATRLLPPSQAAIPWSPNVVRLNLNRPLPFPDGAFKVIYSSHLLEHLYHDQARMLLQECHRVLAPGGICRVVVPDLRAIVDHYLRLKEQGNPGAADRFMEMLMVHERSPKPGFLGWFYRLTGFHTHKWMYDAESLSTLMVLAGFEKVSQLRACQSDILRIKEVENPKRIDDGEGVAFESIKRL